MRYYFDGDNNLYGHSHEEAFSLPSKTKQMGSIESEIKIYVEDYVYTYLYQYGKSGGGREKLAVLVGRHCSMDGQDALVISGAIQGKGTVQENGTERFSDETWEYIGGQMENYFKGMTILGWVHCQPGFGAFLTAKDEEFHREYFKEKWQTLFVLDTMDKLDSFYIYNEEGRGLRQAKGYFIYYDRNREMQEYMLENSMVRPKEGGQEPEAAEKPEKPQDGMRRRPTQEERMDAAKEIRRVLERRAQAAEEAQKTHFRALAGVSCVLCVVCICMGLAMMSSLNRLRSIETELVAVRTSYQTLVEDMEGVKVSAFAAAQQPAGPEKPAEPVRAGAVQAEPVQAGAVQAEILQTEGGNAEAVPASREEKRRYIVEGGDSLGYISRKFYGDNSGISRIMEANDIWDADMIYEGQALWIP